MRSTRLPTNRKKRRAITHAMSPWCAPKLKRLSRCSDRQTRTDHFVSESARIFHFITLQQVRQGPRLPELQCRAHLSSIDVAVKLSSLRAYRRGSEEMSGVRAGSSDLRRLRNGKGGIVRRANFSERGGETDGCRLDVAQGSLPRNAARISRG